MFPALQVKLSGMLSSSKYVVLLDFIPADQFRYKFEYESTSWMVACEEGTPTPSQIYTHPFSPQFGFEWCRAEMSFIKCKLTNNYRENCGHVSFLKFFFFDIIISGEVDSSPYIALQRETISGKRFSSKNYSTHVFLQELVFIYKHIHPR